VAFVLIRNAEKTDLNNLIPLLSELGYQISEEDFEIQANTYIDSDDCELLVAQTEEENLSGLVAGHLFPLIHQPGHVGRIMALIVSEKFQSQGVGSALLESLESWFRENGCRRFEVNSGDHRQEAHEFYQSQGYRVDERRFIKSDAT
jgi:GNAT superfamily N-acetyltransferase